MCMCVRICAYRHATLNFPDRLLPLSQEDGTWENTHVVDCVSEFVCVYAFACVCLCATACAHVCVQARP